MLDAGCWPQAGRLRGDVRLAALFFHGMATALIVAALARLPQALWALTLL